MPNLILCFFRIDVVVRAQLVPGMFLIGLDNQPHQMVPHYVAFIEVAERQTWNGAQYGSSLYETRTPVGGKINLGDVARNHCLGVHADARQEHFHLLGRCVLRLVENDESVVQRPAAHESQRGDLYNPVLDEPLDLVHVQKDMQRIIQRAEIRIDFLFNVSR